MATWVNFSELRGQLSFREILEAYGVTIQTSREQQHQGLCPLPSHQGEKRKGSFSADLARGVWRCFGCKSSGNILDFAVRLEGLNPENGEDVRRVALKLRKKFVERAGDEPSEAVSTAESTETLKQSVLINPPLDFELKSLDSAHEFFADQGLLPDTVARFGLGYCSRGSLKGRIAIPLHDRSGQLVGYVGRLPNDSAVSADEPLYRFPSSREKAGVIHRFDASRLVYNAHRISDRVRKLIVAEEFSLVWHLSELGVSAVALATDQVSSWQREILNELVEPGGLVFLGESLNASKLRAPESATS